uniref:4-alpha-glucanotransferase n=1 Tax=uncultured bacterium contig00201 TaxID=1181608 RepID=A0A806KPR7_9BACT|nr:4-alpha-glucanotransferase (amylomaltase) [uncultured bacterium contig00201]
MSKPATCKRQLGVVVPVGALRSKSGIGVGEFLDLANFAILCKKMRVGLIQILPVNDTGFESSPYSSLTAFGLHPLYLRIDEIEEYKASGGSLKKRLKEARDKFDKSARFSHYNVLKEKLAICRELFAFQKAEIVKSAEGGKLSAWIEQNSWIKQYAVYRRLKEANEGKSWKEWAEYNTVTAEDIDKLWKDKSLWEEHVFWVWLQEALDAQFSKAAQAVANAKIILKGDLPILMNEDSCDVWAHPELFIQDLSAGAPPDMYSPEGQNWGFPIYNWEAQEKDNYAWWRRRLAVAGKYYKAYRIDHVLGFFRIWASSRADYSSALGRFVPYAPVSTGDLRKLGFDKGRVRWLSRPHIPTGEIWDTLKNNWGGPYKDADITAAATKTFSKALERVGAEELWLFKKKIKGEKDIDTLGLHPAVVKYLHGRWHNRLFLHYEKGRFFPVWYFRESTAYKSLSQDEKNSLEALLEKRRIRSEKVWAAQGKKLLSVLVESSPMLPCAEDLGAVPACVPKVLSKLKILGLRVIRWFREWDKPGQPFIPFEEYPELSVCTPSVHDSSTVREWWEREADQRQFAGFIGVPSLPKVYNPGAAKIILSKAAGARSRFRVFQIQDLLHLSNRWYAADPAQERVNVPGSSNEFNWTYRLPATIEEIVKDKELLAAVAE